ncbi:shikimate kinase [Halohasta litchfieldiae]|jgi:shikimate kinase|uniref:Shikimate kinase n=1 Tax=Halohasta litchfieldiae TaxID=1073996 RepID=A0A1H6S6D5_9EURY|nr:shikimate kinase [Halohasta litchfieldiae]ATW89313.1 shikimate kinase [Halohasta litchfieldiae]SEI59285.1 shikimate kinase [Halohasta litchfieldiae]
MKGVASAPGAGTVLNALATHTGSAFAIDVDTTATVDLDSGDTVTGEIDGEPDGDTRLIERCVDLVTERFGDGEGGTVRTESEVPMAAGLKSSSAAANASILATLDALGVDVVDPTGESELDGDGGVDPAADEITSLDACRLGVEAARDVGVTITGAFDDAAASMVGGVVVTDNDTDELLARETRDWEVLVWTPPERAYSADADVDRCGKITEMADLVEELALDGRYGKAMTVNGLAYSAALGFSTDPAIEAMDHAEGVSLSGTGPSVVAVGTGESLAAVREQWAARDGSLLETSTQTTGARIQ